MLSATQRIADRVLRRAGLFAKINRTAHCTINGRRFALPTLNGQRADPTEAWMVEVLRRLFKTRQGPFVDVGVNLGQTLLKVAALDPQRRYIGFEPNPSCVSYAEKLIAANGLSQCSLVPVGLSRTAGIVTLDLFSGTDTDSAASIVPNFRPEQKVSFRKNVAVLSARELPAELLPAGIAVVKIDVEGAELDVLEALLPILQRDRPLVVMEILPCYSAENTDRIARQNRLQALLAENDYRLFRISTDHGTAVTEIDDIGIHGDMDRCDYIACPAADLDAVRDAFKDGRP
ncbi:FkbM family methyltransferase [Caulobacter sp. NIBR1757]|uniref:FkbM family methyltransferase n=1 Tax=Caulobacter sp. NIBR1757 TaxID=3016000 RepID=UPI0022F032E5|nr:FkbM family methyltransferase [Caulobacter sp. NIBR1757]WGM38927.1 hypothetical protein AMEJIAPC_01837 [Caulobacter sp. NIBR1757]